LFCYRCSSISSGTQQRHSSSDCDASPLTRASVDSSLVESSRMTPWAQNGCTLSVSVSVYVSVRGLFVLRVRRYSLGISAGTLIFAPVLLFASILVSLPPSLPRPLPRFSQHQPTPNVSAGEIVPPFPSPAATIALAFVFTIVVNYYIETVSLFQCADTLVFLSCRHSSRVFVNVLLSLSVSLSLPLYPLFLSVSHSVPDARIYPTVASLRRSPRKRASSPPSSRARCISPIASSLFLESSS
jgi:hypothetical protein